MRNPTASKSALLAAALMLALPLSALADCRLAQFNTYRGYGAPGAFKVALGANFGLGDNDQTVIGADGSLSVSEAFALRVGLGRCSSGGSSALVIGGQGLSDFWASEDGKTKLQGAVGLNRVNFNGATTMVMPLQVNVRYVLAPTVDVWGGPEFSYNRFSASNFSTSDSVFGLNAGLTADFNDQVSFRTGLSAQFWSGSTQYGVSTSISLKLPESD